MTLDDVPDSEMPRLPFTHGAGRKPADPQQLDELLRDGSAGGEWQRVSELLQAAAGPASASELAGQAAMVAAFRQAQLTVPARRLPPVRPRMLNTLLTGKLAAVLAAAAVGATGAATAAYADALPDSVQDIAHHLIAAPPAHSHASDTGRAHGHQFVAGSASPTPSVSDSPSVSASPSVSGTPTDSATPSGSPSPSASIDPAAFGLCNAWSNAVKHGLENQVGFRSKLAGIAGGDANITAFCATVQHPGGASESPEASQSPEPSDSSESANEQHGQSGEQHGKSGDEHGNHHGAEVSPTPTSTS